MGEKYPALRYSGNMGGDFEYGVWTIECDSWKEFENRIEEYKNYAYIWRKQRSIEALLPTIYRGHNPDNKSIEEHLSQFKKDMPEAGTLEGFLERLKKERPRELGQDLSEYLNMILPDRNDPKEKYEKDFIDDIYWAIGQHHGLKTRLFDWTKEPYKALFFAFCKRKEKDDKRVVFGLAEKSRLLLNKGQQTKRYIEFLANLGFVKKVLCSYDNPIDIKERIGQMFKRIQAQDGLFTRTLYNQDIEKYIKKCYNTYKERRNEEIVFLIKILIPDGVREDFLEKLEGKGITYKTMYPDLQGAVLHCNLKLYP
jgi:hypothetical protein